MRFDKPHEDGAHLRARDGRLRAKPKPWLTLRHIHLVEDRHSIRNTLQIRDAADVDPAILVDLAAGHERHEMLRRGGLRTGRGEREGQRGDHWNQR